MVFVVRHGADKRLTGSCANPVPRIVTKGTFGDKFREVQKPATPPAPNSFRSLEIVVNSETTCSLYPTRLVTQLDARGWTDDGGDARGFGAVRCALCV